MPPVPKDNSSPASAEAFQPTRWSLISRAAVAQHGSEKTQEAMEWLCRSYWRPVFAAVRRWGKAPEEALDLTQSFFALLIEKADFATIDPSRGRFRSWLLGALNHHLINEKRWATAQKRFHGQPLASLDSLNEIELSLQPIDPSLTPDRAFDRQWALTVLSKALELLQSEYERRGAGEHFEQLKDFLASPPSSGDYNILATKLSITSNHVAVAVKRMRSRFRSCIQEIIAETVLRPEDIEEEMSALMDALR